MESSSNLGAWVLLEIVGEVAKIMDLGREALVGLLLLMSFSLPGSCNLVFEVQHKFKGREKSLNELRAHDVRRHGRLLSVVDLELGGNGHPAETGLAISLMIFILLLSTYISCVLVSDADVFGWKFNLWDVILKYQIV